ncbi:hypothetical protein L249_0288, partial [Ophiocordyceps polyrhachis-furcata BCC 54312]
MLHTPKSILPSSKLLLLFLPWHVREMTNRKERRKEERRKKTDNYPKHGHDPSLVNDKRLGQGFSFRPNIPSYNPPRHQKQAIQIFFSSFPLLPSSRITHFLVDADDKTKTRFFFFLRVPCCAARL